MKIKYNNYLMNNTIRNRYCINSIIVIYNFLASSGCNIYFYLNNKSYGIYEFKFNIIIYLEGSIIKLKLKSINYPNISKLLNKTISC